MASAKMLALAQKHGVSDADATKLETQGLTAATAEACHAALGLTLSQILQLFTTFGPQLFAILQAILAAMGKSPVVP